MTMTFVQVCWWVVGVLAACAFRVPGVWYVARAVARFFSDEPAGVSDGWAVRAALVLADDDSAGSRDAGSRRGDAGCGRIDDDDADSGPRHEPPACEDVTHEFCPVGWAGNGWEPVVGDSGRLEIRYAVRRRKYRMVLRRGDELQWPPYDGVTRPVMACPRGVIAAQLVGFDPADTVDVTERIKKYAGPHYDFHAGAGYRVRLYDMFPNDTDLDLRFRCLRVLYANLVMRDYDFGLDPMIEHPPELAADAPELAADADFTAPTES
jgi:hypothetical protein